MTEIKFLEGIKLLKNSYHTYNEYAKRNSLDIDVESVVKYSQSIGFKFRISHSVNTAALYLLLAGVEIKVLDIDYFDLEDVMRVLAFCSLDVAEDLIKGKEFTIGDKKMYYLLSDRLVQWVGLTMN
ncbi:MAG TPA: hypothetical protein ENH82_09560 [bacterium]|nr:hypothetical protein [bacterium]